MATLRRRQATSNRQDDEHGRTLMHRASATWSTLPGFHGQTDCVVRGCHSATTREELTVRQPPRRPHSSSVCTRNRESAANSTQSFIRPKTSKGKLTEISLSRPQSTETLRYSQAASMRPRLNSLTCFSKLDGSVAAELSRSTSPRRLSRANSIVRANSVVRPNLLRSRSSSALLLPKAVSVENQAKEAARDTQIKPFQALEKFSRAVRMVSVFTALCRSIRRYAALEKAQNYDLYYVRDMMLTDDDDDKPKQTEEAPVSFNKHTYSRESTLYFPLWARWICGKSPENRTEAEISKLVTLLRGMKSFSRFSREAQRNLCRTMTYACFEKRRILVRQGDPGFCLYFIVSGTVSVTVTSKDLKTGVYGTSTVAVLEKNEAFGEIALFSAEALRTATVICRERVEVLVVNREVVLEYCPDVFQREYEEKINTLRKHPLFKDWSQDLLNTLGTESHIRELSHGKLIDPDSTKSEAVYFIIKGKVEMLRRVNLAHIRAFKVSVNLYHDKPLPRPATAMSSSRRSDIVYVRVGCLQNNDTWDLTSLGNTCPEATGNILLSAGVRLLKVPKRSIHELSPKGHVKQFLDSYTPTQRCLSDQEVHMNYLSAQSWLEYRQKVIDNVMDIKKGRFIAHVSSTAKGSTGWSAWPGHQDNNSYSRLPEAFLK